jgi:hypothetical protein
MKRLRKDRIARIALIRGVALIMLAVPPAAFATLGGDLASVETDQRQLRGTLRMAVRAERYVVHELQAPSGTLVRQYAAADGVVFGIAWQGPSMPDLRQVLGGYFPQYVEAAKARRARGPLLIRQPGLVVRSGGRMRAFHGHAYDPRLLPEGVAPEAIR